jgi:hypothetical protein
MAKHTVRAVNPAPAPKSKAGRAGITPWNRTKSGVHLTDSGLQTKLSVVPLPEKKGRWYIEVYPTGDRAKSQGKRVESYVGPKSELVLDRARALVWDDESEAMEVAEKAMRKLQATATNPASRPKRSGKAKPVRTRKTKKKPWIQREGKLGGPGYTDRPQKERRQILAQCVNEYGYRSCLGSIQVLLRSSEIHADTRKTLESDKKWIVKEFGGPGSFGPEENPHGRSPWSADPWDAEYGELRLYIDNERDLYQQRKAIEANLEKKMAKGTYDASKAPLAWMHMVDAGAKKYAKEFDVSVASTFPKKNVRVPLATEYARDFEAEYSRGLRSGNPSAVTRNDAIVLVDQLFSDRKLHTPSGGEIDLTIHEDEWGDEFMAARIQGDVEPEIIRKLEYDDVELEYAPVFLAVQYEFHEGDYGHSGGMIIESVSGGAASAREHLVTMAESGDTPLWPQWLGRDFPDWDSGSVENDGSDFFYTHATSDADREAQRESYDALVASGMHEDDAAQQVMDEYENTLLAVRIAETKVFKTHAEANEWIPGWPLPDDVVIDKPESSSNPRSQTAQIKSRVLR